MTGFPSTSKTCAKDRMSRIASGIFLVFDPAQIQDASSGIFLAIAGNGHFLLLNYVLLIELEHCALRS